MQKSIPSHQTIPLISL